MLATGSFALRLLTPVQASVLFSVLCGFVFLTSYRSLKHLSRWKKYAAIAVRMDLLAVLTLLLAGLTYSKTVKDVSVVILRDASPSAERSEPGQCAAVEGFLAAAEKHKRPNDRVGQLHFSGVATVDALPTATPGGNSASLTPPTCATDPAAAINLGLTLLPADTLGRLVLVWDGHATLPLESLEPAINSAASQGIPIDVLPVCYHLKRPVTLDRLVVPAVAREGAPVNAQATVHAIEATTARVSLFDNGAAVDLDPATPGLQSGLAVRLGQGLNTLSIPLSALPAGVHHLTMTLDHTLAADPLPLASGPLTTLTTEAAMLVHGRPRLLYISSAPPPAGVVGALAKAQFEVTHWAPAQVPTTAAALQAFDVILVGDVPLAASGNGAGLSAECDRALTEYVNALGGGVLLTGGPNTLGAGGWQHSRLAGSLPVSLEPPPDRELPRGALVLAIDASGSMGDQVSGFKATQESVALESAAAALKGLERTDWVGVLSFNTSPTWVRPLGPNTDAAETSRLMQTIRPDGGTDILTAVDAALTELQRLPARVPVRHVVLLTDGNSPTQRLLEVIQRLQDSGVTLSTIAIGSDADEATLATLANAGHGRHYSVTTASSLPPLFDSEARLLRRTLIQEGQFSARFGSEWMASSASSEQAAATVTHSRVTGYVLTGKPVDPRTTLLATVSDGIHADPLLATRQAGLGHTAVLTTDLAGRWTPDWPGASDYDRIVASLLRSIARPVLSRAAEARLTATSPTTALLTLDAFSPDGGFATGMAVTATLLPPDSMDPPKTVRLVQHAPGHYEASIATPSAGAYLAIVQFDDRSGSPPAGTAGGMAGGTAAAGWTATTLTTLASAELAPTETNFAALADLASRTNGRVLSVSGSPGSLFDTETLRRRRTQTPLTLPLLAAALGTLLVDIALRRLDLSQYFSRRATTPPPPAPWALAPNPPSPKLGMTRPQAPLGGTPQAGARGGAAGAVSPFDRLSAAKRRAHEGKQPT